MDEERKRKRPLRLALLGAGTFAKGPHFSIISKHIAAGRVTVRLVWSRTLDSAKELAAMYDCGAIVEHAAGADNDAVASATIALGTHHDNLDAVIIAAPIPQLAALTDAALLSGLPVLCEKPIAADVATAHDLLSRWAPNPRALHAVAENFRFEPVFRKAQQRAADVCGRILAIRLTAQTPMPVGSRYGRGWRLGLPDAGLLVDGGVHHIAGLRMLANADVVSVSARCMGASAHFAGADTAVAALTFSNGLSASVCATYAGSVFNWEAVLVGERGDVAVRRVPGKAGYVLAETLSDGETKEEFIEFTGLESEFEAFFDSVEDGRMHPELCASKAFNDLATVQAMFESSLHNRVVRVATFEVSDR